MTDLNILAYNYHSWNTDSFSDKIVGIFGNSCKILRYEYSFIFDRPLENFRITFT